MYGPEVEAVRSDTLSLVSSWYILIVLDQFYSHLFSIDISDLGEDYDYIYLFCVVLVKCLITQTNVLFAQNYPENSILFMFFYCFLGFVFFNKRVVLEGGIQ